jgi:hypothetical protein
MRAGSQNQTTPSEDFMKERTKAYVAGLVDAEGCIEISKSVSSRGANYAARIRVANKCRPLVKWLVHHFGGYLSKSTPAKESHSVCYFWNLSSGQHTRRFTETIQPYLREKRPQSDLLIQYLNMAGIENPESRESLFQSIRDLKKEVRVTTETPFNSNLDNAYLAGFFDGEGTTSIIKFTSKGRDQYATRIYVTNTNKPILEMYARLYGGTVRDHRNAMKKCYRWELRKNNEREKFLLCMLPYLIVKRDEANYTLQFLRLGSTPDVDKREAIYNLLCNFKTERMIQSHLPGNEQSDPVEIPES